MRLLRWVISIALLAQLTLYVSCSEEDAPPEPCDKVAQSCPDLCGNGTINQSLEVGGRTRFYDHYVPASYQCGNQAPLVIDLHGFGSTKSDERQISDFLSLAEENEFMVVWPQGVSGTLCVVGADRTGNYWNAGFDSSVDDVAFISAIIDQVSASYDIDPARIYATGLSNGGFMSYTLACELGNRIAAIASVTGSMETSVLADCNPERPMPILQIHGTADTVVPYDGLQCSSFNYSGIDELLDFWRLNSNCDETTVTIDYPDTDTGDNSTASRVTFDGCDSNADVELILINGGGHSWPGSVALMGESTSVLYPINNDIDATEMIWDFFNRHTHPDPQ